MPVLSVALGAFVMLGLVDASLGVAWPSLQTFFGRPLSDLGILLVFSSIGYLTASIGYGKLHARLGTAVLLAVGAGFLAGGVAGIALATRWPVVVMSVATIGLGGGLVDTGVNAHAALAFDVGRINLLHACYGMGATLGPGVITMSLLVSNVWRGGYAALAMMQVVSVLAIWKWRTHWAGTAPKTGVETNAGGQSLAQGLLLMLFFLYTGLEVATGQWAFTLLSEGRGMRTAAAGAWVAVYWAGLTVGRFGLGIVGDRLGSSRILNSSVVVALLGLAWLWLDPGGLGAIGLPVAGLGFAAVFPTLVSLTPARIGRTASTRNMGYQLAAANLGAAGVPWVLGVAAETQGLAVLGPGLFVTGALLALMHVISGRASWR
jgi:fucose permease